MTTVKVMYGTRPIDLHLIDTDDMDRLLASPGARASAQPVYIDHKDRMFPVPALPVEFVGIVGGDE